MEEENYFSDQHIMEQSSAMIQRKDGSKSNGISVLVQCVPGMGAVEILLEYSELKAALSELEADREAMPHLYGLGVREDASTQLATVTAERDELASDIVRLKAHLEAADRAAKANGEEAKAANERAEKAEKENDELSQHVCSECDPENYGWVFNRVEGKAVCGCIQEAEAFQILEHALAMIHQAATGEIQIADDDTEGMAWIAKKAIAALRMVLPLEYADGVEASND